MRLAVVLASAVAVLLGGCAASTPTVQPSASAPPPSPSSLPLKGQTFSSPELGISFQCPSEWRIEANVSSFSWSGNGTIKAITRLGAERQAGVTLFVNSGRIAEAGPPGPYMDAPPSYLRDLPSAPPGEMDNPRFMRLGGLRLLCYDGREQIRRWERRWPGLHLYSRSISAPARPTQVIISAGAPPADWEAQRKTLLAVLDSMRFTAPQVSK
jgi:hypothetical protein